MVRYPPESIDFIVNHVILPPKLPQKADDPAISRIAEQHLLQLLSSRIHFFTDQYQKTPHDNTSAFNKAWSVIRTMLKRCATVVSAQYLSTELLTRLFGELMIDDVLLLPIKAQNAMLTLRKTTESIIFECFEASPEAAAVTGCQGSLIRTFPAHARALPTSIFDDPPFRHELAATLSKLDMEVIDEMMPQAQKAGSKMAEVRDTAHPGLVSDMLMAILASLGKPIKACQVSKRTKDDVLWCDTLLPWRRSPLWLAIRVTMQTILCRELLANDGNIQYKNFMICLMSEIALIVDEPPDRCHVILAKLARRVHKLDSHCHIFVQKEALNSCQQAKTQQSLKWKEMQTWDAERPTTIEDCSFVRDTNLSLRASGPYLNKVLADAQKSATSAVSFTPNCRKWLSWSRGLPEFDTSGTTKDEIVFILSAVESWVAVSLPPWIAKFDSSWPASEDCTALAKLGEKYWKASKAAYDGAPEQLSIMLLVIAELWQALDCLVISLFPLLKQYSPEVSTDLFFPLLLPKKSHMQRLHKVELYIKIRYSQATPSNPSIFSNPQSGSFAVAYYATSTTHKNLRDHIEAEALTNKEAKKVEWENASAEHKRLLQESQRLQCENTQNDDGWTVHSPSCRRCYLNRQANRMKISKYEWPLPPDEHSCICAVFELNCPVGFLAWRNFTWMMTNDIGRPEWTRGEQPAVTLQEYSELQKYNLTQSSRMVLASVAKSILKTHYTHSFPVRYEDICSQNALRYKMLDGSRSVWVEEQVSKPSLRYICTQPLPNGPYKSLQSYVDWAGHPQNSILAQQDICDHALSLHEFISFGSLRSDGEKTQWLNIQRELTDSNLTLNNESVSTLILRAALQAGSSGDNTYRVSHSILENQHFCRELLAKVGVCLNSVEANWKSDYTMMLLVKLTLRVLSLSSHHTIISLALDILERIRSITQHWMGSLRVLLQNTTREDLVQTTQRRLFKTAMLCKLTFDVDGSHILQILGIESNLSIWVIACVVVRENTTTALPSSTNRMYLHDMKLTHRLYRDAHRLITTVSNKGLAKAVSEVWPNFQSEPNRWDTLSSPNERWVTAQTKVPLGYASQVVLYNVLDGELLVDGRPLGRLPMEYISSNAYRRIFGAQILNVFAADMPGMRYMTATEIHGYFVYFTIREKKVVIKVRQNSQQGSQQNSQVLEYIPPEVFQGDMPSHFVHDYVHWLNLLSHEIDFRPVKQLWTDNTNNWRLQYRAKSESHLCQRNLTLIDVRSPTFARTMDVFRALEDRGNTHVSLSSDHQPLSSDHQLRVHLPRFDLHFFLNTDGHFECRELCRIVDPDQSLRTMIGLKSRLVLCSVGLLARKHDRIVTIPDGEVLTSRKGSHVTVTISPSSPSVRKIRLFRYQIDGVLHRLQGPGDMTSILYRAYLHAVTSHVLPDPFTGNTGTEEALAYLRSKSTSLTKPADKETIRLLKLIAELTPVRRLYPQYLKVMQQVKWNPNLSMVAQHDDFIVLAQQILASGDRFLVFHPDSKEAPSLYDGSDKILLTRAKIRNSKFYNFGSGDTAVTTKLDVSYRARDRISSSERAARTFSTASLVRDWPTKCEVTWGLLQELQAFGVVSGFKTKFDSSKPLSELLKLSLATSWAALFELCRSSSQQRDLYQLLFLFSTIAYGEGQTDPIRLATLLAFAFSRELRAIGSPQSPSFTLTHGFAFSSHKVQEIVQDHMENFEPSLHAKDPRAEGRKYNEDKKTQITYVLAHYSAEWPCEKPGIPWLSKASLFKVEAASVKINELFSHWTKNGEFQSYILAVQSILDRMNEGGPFRGYHPDAWQMWHATSRLDAIRLLPTLSTLMSAEAPSLPQKPEVKSLDIEPHASASNSKLQNLVESLGAGQGDLTIRKRYSDDLVASLEAFSVHKDSRIPEIMPRAVDDLLLGRADCEVYMSDIFECICDVLKPKDSISRLLDIGALWPRLTVRSVISHLVNLSKAHPSWKSCLLGLGEAITMLQRARRLLLSWERHDIQGVCAELENVGHVGWDTNRWPEWLLIEIENDLLIRPTQAQVALEMLNPSSSSNSLTQLNMGEGKSSVIVPLVAAAIADGSRLARVIVLKSLAKQMSDTLAVRLGGLLDRPIFFMPFTRKIELSAAKVGQIQALQENCKASKGILLAQPEHILSFQLIGLERLTAGDFGVASHLLKAQSWLNANARDLLDESDEILDVKFQLIYTLGTQRLMDGQPDRWLVTQSMFDLIEKHAAALQKEYPGHVELNYRTKSSFPTIRLLSDSISEKLMCQVADDVLQSHLPALSFEQCPTEFKTAVLYFIQDIRVTKEETDTIKKFSGGGVSFFQNLLLIRGLIAYKILPFVFRGKRWSVDYGLHPKRCLSAVPYRAKDVPAPSAEFGHPDVAIALTCLSYYYTGLSSEQIRQCFELLSKADDPSHEYGTWISRCTDLPTPLRDWSAVNLEDDHQCNKELFPALRHCKKLADYFLANVVFPKEGKEFDEKLSTSGWDVPAKVGGPHLTTGFSGTNDNRFLLPLSIEQKDLPSLQHTSGKVLDYVLRTENLRYLCAKDAAGRQMSSEKLLHFIVKYEPRVRVLIDVGAQILDVSNEELIRTWMAIEKDVDAGIFFSKDDTVMVLTRDKKLETLTASSFQARMDRCLVYLDEVHTRGTDLKLPLDARAAVTLGPRLVKDKLVQACMRLRKLGHGQSLMFVAPPEVHQSIRKVTNKEGEIDGYDVVAWSLEQSCRNIERSQPLRILQGLNYYQRQEKMASFVQAFPNLGDVAKEKDTSKAVISGFKEVEQQRLSDLYTPPALRATDAPSVIESSRHNPNATVQELLRMWQDVDPSVSDGASMHEEHEREVAHEVEQETQVQRPLRVKPLGRTVDASLKGFIQTGSSEAFERFTQASIIVVATSARDAAAGKLFSSLKVTTDFKQTVERPRSGHYDSYLRPATWVLTSNLNANPARILLISQFEANHFFDLIHSTSAKVTLHTYTPRVMKSMLAVDLAPPGQTYPSVVGWQSLTSDLRREMHLFAGQLYFNSHNEYRDFLAAIVTAQPAGRADETLRFIKAWIAVRRKGQNFLPTHMGQVVSNRTLQETAFE